MCYRWTRAKAAWANWAVAPLIFSLESFFPVQLQLPGVGRGRGGGVVAYGRTVRGELHADTSYWNVEWGAGAGAMCLQTPDLHFQSCCHGPDMTPVITSDDRSALDD